MERVFIPPDDDRMIDEKEAARMTGFSTKAFQEWRYRGGGPRFTKFGRGRNGRVRYRLRDVQAWIDQHPSYRNTSQRSTEPAPLKVREVRWVYFDHDGRELSIRARFGIPIMVIDFDDGRTARVAAHQSLLRENIMAVELIGNGFKDCIVTVTDADTGRQKVMENATDNDTVVALTMYFVRAVEKHAFKPKTLT